MRKTTAPRVGIFTLGCKVNQYESEAIAELFTSKGFVIADADERCDVYVINTCTVTAESDRKAGQLIRRAATKNPDAPILVTGCFSQSHPERVAAIKGVDFVCGNTDKLAVVAAAERLLKERAAVPEIAVSDVQCAPFEPMTITRFDRTRAYVKIEDGCENRCSYCAIPAARGKVRSKPLAEIVREVEGLVRGGCREVVLTGIETASWGRDLAGVTLADLLEAVDGIKGLERMRLGSLEPTVMREEFVQRIAKLRTVVPHFHLSMQSGSARVLAGMRRRYNPAQAMEGIRRLRAAMPDVELTTDFIVGFPGESEADFEDTMRFAKEAEFLQMHVFAYSKREGTPAATMPGQIEKSVKKERSARLIALGEELTAKRLARALETPLRPVLFETFADGIAVGHTCEFFEVAVPSSLPLDGEIRSVRTTRAENGRLIGELSE